jgi:hypothetical protein
MEIDDSFSKTHTLSTISGTALWHIQMFPVGAAILCPMEWAPIKAA